MSKKITEQQVRHIAKLSRLNCTDDEICQFAGQLGAILEYIAQLDKLDTGDTEPLAHCLAIKNVFRADEPGVSLSNDEVLANAPQRDGEFFAVPKVLGDASA